jgi:hypothetical protein
MDNVNYFLPYQQAWLDDKSLIRVWEKSRRIGATYIQSFEDVTDCVLGLLPKSDQNIWFAAQTEKNAKEYIKKCLTWVNLYNIIHEEIGIEICSTKTEDQIQGYSEFFKDFNITAKKGVNSLEIKFYNGSAIHVLTSNPSNFRGNGGKIVLDEFAFHPNPEELWDTITPCVDWGGRICILSTHEEPENYYNQLIKKIRDGRLKDASVHRVTLLDAVEMGLVEKVNKVTNRNTTRQDYIDSCYNRCRTIDQYHREYLCEPRKDLGLLAIKGFSEKNKAKVEYKPYIYITDVTGNLKQIENPIYLFCDFNWSQNCWGLGHFYDNDFFKFKEFCMDLVTPDLAPIVVEYITGTLKHKGLIIINGDVSGKKHTSNSKSVDYQIIENALIDAGFPKENHYYKSGKRYRKVLKDHNGRRSRGFYLLNSTMSDINGEPHFYVNPETCPMSVYAYENLKLKPGTSQYQGYTEKQLEKNPNLKYLDDIVDHDRYWVATNLDLEKKSIKVPERPLTPLEIWNGKKKRR